MHHSPDNNNLIYKYHILCFIFRLLCLEIPTFTYGETVHCEPIFCEVCEAEYTKGKNKLNYAPILWSRFLKGKFPRCFDKCPGYQLR